MIVCVCEREKKIESENIKDIYQENTNTPEIVKLGVQTMSRSTPEDYKV